MYRPRICLLLLLFHTTRTFALSNIRNVTKLSLKMYEKGEKLLKIHIQ